MSTYFDKKKMLEDNKDLYISSYDKELSNNALSEIITQKKNYAKAKESGDRVAMSEANRKANEIRLSEGAYSGGDDGSEYNKALMNYEIRPNTSYVSPYAKEKNKIVNKISNIDDFSYNYETDPLFKSYRNLYMRLGDRAYERALSENSLRTGGMINSSAQTSAALARNHYNTMLTEKIPELYKLAYQTYSDKYERLYKSLEALTDIDNEEYKRYRDSVEDFEKDRDYYYNKEKDSSDNMYDRYKFDTNTESDKYEFDTQLNYKKESDAAKAEYERQRDAANDAYRTKALEAQIESDKLSAVINLAKALYGKTSISQSVISNLMNMVE
ncbi:MAG: hypothetical protein II998_02745 [Clostridia bacterium]|nr:hypothetical protein [Clostridia bacterium]